MSVPEPIARRLLRRTMHRYDLGWDIPGEALPLPQFLSETTIFFTELFLKEALISVTEPYEDEVIAGGVVSYVVANGLGRVFDTDHESIGRTAFYDLYCFAFLSDPNAHEYYWRLTRTLYSRISESTPVLDPLKGSIADFYEIPSDRTLQSVGQSVAALRKALNEG